MSDRPAPQQPLSLLSTKAGPLSIRAWLFLALIGFVALMYYKQLPPDINNAEYVQTLLDKGTLPRTAGSIIRDARPKNTPGDAAAKAADDAKWTATANNLATCLETQAKAFLTSGDPYLQQHFDPKTPNTIATRLLTACNAMHYLTPEEGK